MFQSSRVRSCGWSCDMHIACDSITHTLQTLPIEKLQPQTTTPERKTSQAAGYDLTPTEEFQLQPGEQQLIDTGIAIAIPEGYYGQLHSRSSLARKGITVEGGVIDADY